LAVSVEVMGVTSNEVGFAVILESTGLSLSASRNNLPYLSPVAVNFTVKYLGESLPVGTSVKVNFEAGELTGLPGSTTLDADSKFSAPNLKALTLSGPLAVSVEVMGVTSNEVGFAVILESTGLSLSASRNNLPYLSPVAVNFTVKYLGESLPVGMNVKVNFEAGELTGLPGSTTLDENSKFSAPNLKALTLSGPLAVSVEVMGVTSNEVGFAVILESSGLSFSASRNNLPYLSPVAVNFTVKYLGESLPVGTNVKVNFEAGELTGSPASTTLDADSKFSAPNLKALTLSGPLAVSVEVMGVTSNEVSFAVILEASGLSLSASRDELIYLSPVSVDFTVKYLGQSLPMGTSVKVVFDQSKLAGLATSVTLDGNGQFNAPGLEALTFAGPLKVYVEFMGESSNEVGFEVTLGAGSLTLSASKNSLEFLEETEVAFVVSFEGTPLPAGAKVNFNFNQSELGGLPQSAILGQGGKFTAQGLKALAVSGNPAVSASFGSLTSNQVSFGIDFDPANLSLSADPVVLELYVATETAFGFKYKGAALPGGILVGLSANVGQLENLTASGVTDANGNLVVPNLTAINPHGPIEVRGSVLSYAAGKVDLDVFIDLAYLDLAFESSPNIDYQFPHLPPEGGPYLKSCVDFSILLTAKYRGRALAGANVYVSGFGFTPAVMMTTDQNGEVTGNIWFDGDQEDEYNLVGNDYFFTINSLTKGFAGPKASKFSQCAI
jgi:hypothetical protein